MINCKNFEKSLRDYIIEELPEEQSEEMRFHLSQCAKCRALYEQQTAVQKALQGTAEVRTVPFVSSRGEIFSSINKNRYDKKLASRLHFFFKRNSESVLGAAVLALFICIGVYAVNHYGSLFKRGSQGNGVPVQVNQQIIYNYSDLIGEFGKKKEDIIGKYGQCEEKNNDDDLMLLEYKEKGIDFSLDNKNIKGVFSIQVSRGLNIEGEVLDIDSPEITIRQKLGKLNLKIYDSALNPYSYIIVDKYRMDFFYDRTGKQDELKEIVISYNTTKTDAPDQSNTIRGEGISKFGTIRVIPNGIEEVGTLGADSAYGKASDFTFNADYNIVFKDSANNEKIIGTIEKQNIPVIIQPKDTIIKMNKLQISDNEIFIFIPQYAGSNAIPLYAFLVNKNGEASQINFLYDNKSGSSNFAPIISTTSPKFELPSIESNLLIFKSLINASPDSPDLKLYKLMFKLEDGVFILTSKSLQN